MGTIGETKSMTTTHRTGEPSAIDGVTRAVLALTSLLTSVQPRSEAGVERWNDLRCAAFPTADRRRQQIERLRRLDDRLDHTILESLDEHLRSLPTLQRTFRRLDAGEILRDADFFELKRFIYHAISILRIADGLDELPDAHSPPVESLRSLMETIHPEQAPSTRFHLADELDDALARSRDQMRSVRNRYKQRRRKLEDSIVNEHGGNFDIRGRYRPDKEQTIDDQRLRWDEGFYRLDDASLRSLSTELDEARARVHRRENRQRRRLTDVVDASIDALTSLQKTLVAFDVHITSVELKRHLDGCWPTFSNDVQAPWLKLEAGRDPLLVDTLGFDDVQAIDVEFRRPGTVVLGPNMGGKSALLRLIGVAQWCAQMGLPVPADRCTVSDVDRIIYVGSEQPDRSDVTEGLSSFGREVRRFVDHWDVDATTLWLLDEPGRGTHPEEGADLAETICRRRIERGDRVVVATHFPRLADADDLTTLRIAGLAIDDHQLEQRLASASDSDIGPRLEATLRRCMDYSVVESLKARVPRDARRVARALGLDLDRF